MVGVIAVTAKSLVGGFSAQGKQPLKGHGCSVVHDIMYEG